MPSIINGLFAGRSGIASHGTAIAVVGDNISNASTLGFKAARAEFEDIIAGGQTSGKVVGAGSQLSAVAPIFEQGSLEFTGRALDLAIDGNGFFAVADGAQRFYTRAGNFKVNSSGFVVNQDGLAVLGFPSGGSGALEPININAVSQESAETSTVSISGNLDASAATFNPAGIPNAADIGAASNGVTFADLNADAEFSTVVQVFDSLGQSHNVTLFFWHSGTNEYRVGAYVNSEDVGGTPAGEPRQIPGAGPNGLAVLSFGGDGQRSPAPSAPDFNGVAVAWGNGSDASSLDISFDPFTQYAASSSILSISQDGQGVGTVTSVSIASDGTITALLDNGQNATIGHVGLVNFANPEGLTRIGGQLLQQSIDSGEPIIGKPLSGTFGAVQSGSVELSTVDIANEFVKLITLQRGFQANSRIITTINQLLNEIIQLA